MPIVVTSRIVGYRDMPYRMGAGFEHGLIAELTREDKDHFARRWIEVTEQHHLLAEREKRAQELIEALWVARTRPHRAASRRPVVA